MPGKHIAYVAIGLTVVVVLSLFLLNRESTVSGRVTWNGTPIAAGQIVFESPDNTLNSQISDGRYEIRKPQLAGEYKVRIEIHFVDTSGAADFYENLTQELNPEKELDPDSELNRKPPSDAEPSAKDLPSLTRIELDEKLSNGRNTRNYDLPLTRQ